MPKENRLEPIHFTRTLDETSVCLVNDADVNDLDVTALMIVRSYALIRLRIANLLQL